MIKLKLTAVGSGYYKVKVNGEIRSQHVTEREAMESATNRKRANPADVVEYGHPDYRVLVEEEDVPAPAPEPPPVEPPPVEPPPVEHPPSGDIISALMALQPGQLFEFPDSSIMKVNPCPGDNCVYSLQNGFMGIMDAWSGAAWNPVDLELYVFGGGHNGYGGNEVVAFSLETGKWRLLSQPSEQITLNPDHWEGVNGVSYYADGTPAARHSYSIPQYHPALKQMFISIGYGKYTDSFDPLTGKWDSAWKPYAWHDYIDRHGTMAFSQIDGCLYAKPDLSGPLYKFDPTKRTDEPLKGEWTQISDQFYLNPDATSIVSPDTNRLIFVGYGIGGVAYVDLNNPPKAWPWAPLVRPKVTGDARGLDLLQMRGIGIDYDPIGKRFILWQEGDNFFELDETTWVIRKLALPANAVHVYGVVDHPVAGEKQVYGRFRYVPGVHGVVGVKKSDQPVFFLKLTDETEPIQEPIPPALVNGKVQTLQQAVDAAQPGDTTIAGEGLLTLGAKVYKPLTFVGVPGKTILRKGVVDGKNGQLVIQADTTVRGFTFELAVGNGGNEAGIWQEVGKITAEDCEFVDCYNGILGSNITVKRCSFLRCGNDKGETSRGFTHAIYAIGGDLLHVEESTFAGTKIGHHIKSRAKATNVINVHCEAGTESYTVDCPNGGKLIIDGLVATQGAQTDNQAMINFGSEGAVAGITEHSIVIGGTTRRTVLKTDGVVDPVCIRVSDKTPAHVTVENTDFVGFTLDQIVTGWGVLSKTFTNCTLNGAPISEIQA